MFKDLQNSQLLPLRLITLSTLLDLHPHVANTHFRILQHLSQARLIGVNKLTCGYFLGLPADVSRELSG